MRLAALIETSPTFCPLSGHYPGLASHPPTRRTNFPPRAPATARPATAGPRDSLPLVANLQKRGSYTPRRVREKRAYQLVVAGGTAGAVGIVTLALAVAGVVGGGIPLIAFLVAAMCFVLFRSMTRPR